MQELSGSRITTTKSIGLCWSHSPSDGWLPPKASPGADLTKRRSNAGGSYPEKRPDSLVGPTWPQPMQLKGLSSMDEIAMLLAELDRCKAEFQHLQNELNL